MRRRAVIAPIALLAGALLAWRLRRSFGAAQPQPRLGASTPTAPASGRAPVVSLAATAPPSPAADSAPTAPPPHPSRFVSVPWTLVAAPADRAELTIRFARDERFELDRIDAQETPTQVFVTVLMRRPPVLHGDSAGKPQEREATVALSGPLGTRELVHAPEDLSEPADGEPSARPLYP